VRNKWNGKWHENDGSRKNYHNFAPEKKTNKKQ